MRMRVSVQLGLNRREELAPDFDVAVKRQVAAKVAQLVRPEMLWKQVQKRPFLFQSVRQLVVDNFVSIFRPLASHLLPHKAGLCLDVVSVRMVVACVLVRMRVIVMIVIMVVVRVIVMIVIMVVVVVEARLVLQLIVFELLQHV